MSWSFPGRDLILLGTRQARQSSQGGNNLVVTLNTGPAGEADLGDLSVPASGVERIEVSGTDRSRYSFSKSLRRKSGL
jgi:hypothetical protein